jgi:DNA polymerase I-like protein with 3'-5' exonuclease and polymerase domains
VARDRNDKSTISFFERMELGEKLEPDWNIPSGYPDLTQYPQIAIDLETCDPNLTTLGPGWARNDGFIVGIAVAAGDQAWYFPIRHGNGHNLDPKMTLKWLKKQMATPHIDKIMHNATYDAGWLRAEGVEVQGRIIDTMIAAPIIDENRFSYSLNNLGRDYIDMRKDEKMLRAAAKDWGIDPKKDMWQLPPAYVGAYAEQDALMTLKLWDRLKTEISSQDLTHIFNLETSIIPLMVEMRARGVRVNLDQAEIARKGLRAKVRDLKAEIKHKTGVDIEPWAPASVQQVFDALNLQYPKTEAGAPSFTKHYLNAHPHEVCQVIVRLREFDKADSTFIDSILRHEHNGRIHTEFHQLRSDDGGTVTGRFCVSADTLIETQRGPVPIVDVKPRQDLALTHLGRFQFIRHLIYKGEEEMVALRVSSGSVVKCTRNHRVLTAAGWKRVGELTVGQEIAGVDFEKRLGERRTVPEGSRSVLGATKADYQRGGSGSVHYLSHSTGDVEARRSGSTAEGGAGAEVFPFQNWLEKSNEGKDRQPAPQPQRAAVLRPAWIHPCAQTGLVHGKADVETRIRASGGYGADTWFDRGARGHARSSHQRGSSGQFPGQLGVGDAGGASFPTLSVTVEEIEPLGVAQVWDIEVETDHSYVAHGLIHHNSSSSPNLQQIPARDPDIKKLIRGLFIPEEGQMWGSFDYSSQEPRLLVHFAASMPDSMRSPVVDSFVEGYQDDNFDFHQMVADIAGINRKAAKVCGLGIMYGMGIGKLAAQLSISDAEAKDLMGTFNERVPFVKQLATVASNQAEKNGQIRTILGRLCRFHLWEPRTFGYNKPLPLEEAKKEYGSLGNNLRRAFTYKALNKLIQGSAADQTKKAMADCYAEGIIPMLTVHDELCFSVDNASQAEQIKEIMETGLPLKIPSKVDVDIPAMRGLPNNWGEVE